MLILIPNTKRKAVLLVLSVCPLVPPYFFITLPTVKDLKLILLHDHLDASLVLLTEAMFRAGLAHSVCLQEPQLGKKSLLFTLLLRQYSKNEPQSMRVRSFSYIKTF